MTRKLGKTLIIILTGILFSLGVFSQLFSLLIPEIFYLVSFCLMIGLLADYAWSIRKQLVALIPAWMAVYPLYLLLDNMPGLKWVSFYLEFVYFLFYPVFGVVLFIIGLRALKKQYTAVGFQLMALGVTSSLLIMYELAKDWTTKKFMPLLFTQNVFHFKWLWLLIFLQTLLLDVFGKLEEKEMKETQSVLRWGLAFLALRFFSDYLFI